MSEPRPLGNVLVATDFSPGAMRAVDRAARLPLAPGSTLTVLHVLPSAAGPRDRSDAERVLADAVARAVSGLGGKDVAVAPHVGRGVPFAEIARAARGLTVELVVVGRHGGRRFRELVLGSTAERVIRRARTPVLVVASAPAGPYERPLVAVDGSEGSRAAVELASRVAASAVQRLEVVHAYEPIFEGALRRAGIVGEAARRHHVEAKERARAGVEAFLQGTRAPTPAAIVLREGDARRAILDVAVQHDSDLLALGTHGRTGLTHALVGSVAEAVVRGATCDVLVVRETAAPAEAS